MTMNPQAGPAFTPCDHPTTRPWASAGLTVAQVGVLGLCRELHAQAGATQPCPSTGI